MAVRRRGISIRRTFSFFYRIQETSVAMLRFAHPDCLWALALLPMLALVFLMLNARRKKDLATFVAPTLWRTLVPEMSGGKRLVKQALHLLALGFLVLAAANPQVGTRLEEVQRRGIDIIVTLDVSLSMKAEDIRPNRLAKAKRDVSQLLRKLRGDRVGLVVFAGEAYVQFPLTADYSAADLFINAVDVDAVPTPGTAIGKAIELALRSFRDDVPTQKAIIVVSDGEDTEGDVNSAVEKANKHGVRIYSIGMGTPDGGPIPIVNAAGVRTDYKRDRAGSIVLTRLDETTLQQIALATKGAYRRATSGGNEIDEVFDELDRLEKAELGSMQVAGYEDRFQYPLAVALLLLLVEMMISERRGALGRKLARWIPATGVVALATTLGTTEARAQTVRSHVKQGNEAYRAQRFSDAEVAYKKALQENASSREASFNLGNALYKQERYEDALRSMNSTLMTAPTDVDRAAAYHNIGNTYFKSGKLREAVDAYKQSLRLNPNDDDTRYNLQMAMDRQAQQEKSQQQNQEGQQDKDRRDNKDQGGRQDRNEEKGQQQEARQQEANQQEGNEQRPQQSKAKQAEMSKEEAERILEAMKNAEKAVQQLVRKREGPRVSVEKDW
jgi:tetratricopeptide (TPR) repeat protein